MALGDDLRHRCRTILACPTAPFQEERVHAAIRAAVRASPRLRARRDPFGNLEVVYGRGRPRLLFACHTDHPALEANGDGTAAIRGGLRAPRLRGVGLRDFDGTRVASVGTVVRDKPGTVRLVGGNGVARGTPLVLDVPAVRITKRHVRARAIDDLCAVAACLTLFDRLAAARWRGTVGAVFTRAEEVGFAGALGWVRESRFPLSTTIVNLEMSTARDHTPQGQGPILRVGDRITTFTQSASVDLDAVAKKLAEKDEHFRYQRALMDGGACEATVFASAGYRAGALCLPLKNTHNHTEDGGIGLEQVHAADAENLVRWMVAFTRSFGREPAGRAVERRLEKLWRRHRRRLERSAEEIP